MKPEYYQDIQWLIEQPQWATYQKLLEDERQMITTGFELAPHEELPKLQQRLAQTKKIMRMPLDLVSEQKDRNK